MYTSATLTLCLVKKTKCTEGQYLHKVNIYINDIIFKKSVVKIFKP